MANKSPQAQEQRDIANFVQWLERCIAVENMELGAVGSHPSKFVRHDGHTFSTKLDNKRCVIMTINVQSLEEKGP